MHTRENELSTLLLFFYILFSYFYEWKKKYIVADVNKLWKKLQHTNLSLVLHSMLLEMNVSHTTIHYIILYFYANAHTLVKMQFLTLFF